MFKEPNKAALGCSGIVLGYVYHKRRKTHIDEVSSGLLLASHDIVFIYSINVYDEIKHIHTILHICIPNSAS